MEIQKSDIEKRIDIIEDEIARIHPAILRILIKDKTTRGNILWCTKDYEHLGEQYAEKSPMQVELITGANSCVIQPRASKSKAVQELRIKKRAEVFTPSWVCNEQNNKIDESWFLRSNVFNTPNGVSWTTTPGKILFPDKKKNWQAYVNAKRLEITCGEAPYLASRYDTTTGELIPIYERIGLFDRKMRVVNENCENEEQWLIWSFRALKSVYGFEFQGDSVLIARENMLYDYIDYYKARFKNEPPIKLLKKVANIIAWNIWQMDGLKCVVPFSCNEQIVENNQMNFFDTESDKTVEIIPCPGCDKNNIFAHNGIYCRIYDWTNLNKSIPFISVLKKGVNYGTI